MGCHGVPWVLYVGPDRCQMLKYTMFSSAPALRRLGTLPVQDASRAIWADREDMPGAPEATPLQPQQHFKSAGLSRSAFSVCLGHENVEKTLVFLVFSYVEEARTR